MSDRPKRAFTIELVAGGDTFADAADLIREMADHVGDHGVACDFVSGGPSRGGFIRISKRPEMTHDRYHDELRKHLDAERSARNACNTPKEEP